MNISDRIITAIYNNDPSEWYSGEKVAGLVQLSWEYYSEIVNILNQLSENGFLYKSAGCHFKLNANGKARAIELNEVFRPAVTLTDIQTYTPPEQGFFYKYHKIVPGFLDMTWGQAFREAIPWVLGVYVIYGVGVWGWLKYFG